MNNPYEAPASANNARDLANAGVRRLRTLALEGWAVDGMARWFDDPECNVMAEPYQPINCEFHDVLEATAMRARVVVIVFRDATGQPETVHARITDLIAHEGVEHMLLDSGERIRLDDIISVDGVQRADFTSY